MEGRIIPRKEQVQRHQAQRAATCRDAVRGWNHALLAAIAEGSIDPARLAIEPAVVDILQNTELENAVDSSELIVDIPDATWREAIAHAQTNGSTHWCSDPWCQHLQNLIGLLWGIEARDWRYAFSLTRLRREEIKALSPAGTNTAVARWLSGTPLHLRDGANPARWAARINQAVSTGKT